MTYSLAPAHTARRRLARRIHELLFECQSLRCHRSCDERTGHLYRLLDREGAVGLHQVSLRLQYTPIAIPAESI